MTFTYTEVFGGQSPLQGGFPVNSMCGGTWGMTSGPAIASETGHITTPLTSHKVIFVDSSLHTPAASGAYAYSASTNIIQIYGGLACSGTYLAFGI